MTHSNISRNARFSLFDACHSECLCKALKGWPREAGPPRPHGKTIRTSQSRGGRAPRVGRRRRMTPRRRRRRPLGLRRRSRRGSYGRHMGAGAAAGIASPTTCWRRRRSDMRILGERFMISWVVNRPEVLLPYLARSITGTTRTKTSSGTTTTARATPAARAGAVVEGRRRRLHPLREALPSCTWTRSRPKI